MPDSPGAGVTGELVGKPGLDPLHKQFALLTMVLSLQPLSDRILKSLCERF